MKKNNLQLIENDINELLLENTIIGNNLNDINKNISTKLSKENKRIEINEINFPYVNINYENSETIKKKFDFSLNENNNKIKNNPTNNNEIKDTENKRKELEISNKKNKNDINANLNQINNNNKKIPSEDSTKNISKKKL